MKPVLRRDCRYCKGAGVTREYVAKGESTIEPCDCLEENEFNEWWDSVQAKAEKERELSDPQPKDDPAFMDLLNALN